MILEMSPRFARKTFSDSLALGKTSVQPRGGTMRASFLRVRIFIFFGSFFLAAASFAAETLKVGLVLDKGGRKDQSFNEGTLNGAMRAKAEFNILVKDVVAADDTSYEALLMRFARRKFDLVIAVGFVQKDAVTKAATRFPNTHFAIVDAVVEKPNVRSLMFAEHEGSYLAGALAALTSETGKIGFIGGMDIPLIRRFLTGYRAGAEAVRPEVKVVSNFVGVTGTAWNNPPRARELALGQYGDKVDVIFVAAGASGSGVFDATEETRRSGRNPKAYAIGVDSNQNHAKPGMILTSMMKRVDVAAYDTIRNAVQGRFEGGVKTFSLKDDGVALAYDAYNEKLIPPAVRARIDELRAQIIAGKIKVPDYYEMRGKGL